MEITGCGDDRYEVAKEHACRLLYVGDDFVKTDIEGVL
jgi:ribonuclease VapC